MSSVFYCNKKSVAVPQHSTPLIDQILRRGQPTMGDYIKKLGESLVVGVKVESKLIGEASKADAGKALIRFYTLLGFAVLLFLGSTGIGLMFWLMK